MIKNRLGKTLALLIILIFIGANFFPTSVGFVSEDNTALLVDQKYSDLDFDDNITLLMKQAKIPSLSACIVKNDSVVWHNGYGFYNRLLRKKPSDDTVYMAGSVSKAVTATALMQLYEKGLFDLDDDVSDYLPFVLRNPSCPDVLITFRMLMSHQSSLPNVTVTTMKDLILFGIVCHLFPLQFPYPAIEEYLVPGGRLYHESVWTNNYPGEEFNYSNMGYLILEYLIEQLSGQSYDSYCKEHIFEPLSMYNTTFSFKDIKRKQRAVPYLKRKGILVRIPFYDVPKSGAGGLVTSIDDLSHFLIAHMNNGVYENERILNESSVELMHTIHAYNNNTGILDYYYGLGWMFFDMNGTIYQGHDGDTPGFSARMVYNENNKTGVIFLINRTRRNIEDLKLSRELMEMFFSKADEL